MLTVLLTGAVNESALLPANTAVKINLSDPDELNLWRTRSAYLQGGVELAVFDVQRSGRPPQYDTDAEARVTALACSAPPVGRQRWTLVELERLARQEPSLSHVSRETVRRMLKKTISNPGVG